jgi:hypothetical protein
MQNIINRSLLLIGLILAGSILLVGCIGLEKDKPVEEPGSVELTEEEILALVKENLAKREDVDVDEIGHPNVEQVTWGDTSLGCPEEGMMYAEVETTGYRILLSIGGPASIEQFDYRTDLKGNFVLCE